ncbi:cysteine hydrolase family protein [Salinarimonas ramus]|uniref:Isochorismatase n=1 Tax=Salinarimonas ramus TaxID=690164 RepID=A0A917QGB7_9HYPH|nr:cysteine hydrolase family protein [Salinarimonas ramus]GGK49199.1 isochorismatase [Salinarimonas ramus]
MTLSTEHTALVLVDVQEAFAEREAAGERRNNPGAGERIAALLAAFRTAGASVIHVRHASRAEGSRLRPERPGYAVMECAREVSGEPVLVKSVNSAFIGTDLEERLRAGGIATVTIVGATTNHCCETTTRMAGNLGFEALFVRDATWTFDMPGADGGTIPAQTIHDVTLANLSGEFARIVTAQEVIDALARR